AVKVRSKRVEMLHELISRHAPRFVFCYGKSNWDHYREVFREASFEPVLDGRVELARLEESVVALTPFFVPYRMTRPLIDELASLIENEPRAIPFAGLGRSGHRNTARDMEEILHDEWGKFLDSERS